MQENERYLREFFEYFALKEIWKEMEAGEKMYLNTLIREFNILFENNKKYEIVQKL